MLVDLPRGLQGEQPERLDLHPRIGDHLLDQLLVRKHAALGVSGDSPLAEHVVDAPDKSDSPHRVVDSPAAKPRLGDDERSAARPQHVIGRDANVLVTDVALPATATERLVAEPDIT